MSRLISALFLFAGFCAVAALAQEKPSDSRIFISNVTVINVDTGEQVPHRTVIVSGERIAEVKDSRGVRPPTGAKIVDGTGRYLIPGLWDMHVHTLFPERVDSMFPMFIANGVLGIRDLGSSMPLSEIGQLRQATKSGSRLGPLIVAAGPILDGRPKPLRPNFLAITTPAAGRAEVDTLKNGGADLAAVRVRL